MHTSVVKIRRLGRLSEQGFWVGANLQSGFDASDASAIWVRGFARSWHQGLRFWASAMTVRGFGRFCNQGSKFWPLLRSGFKVLAPGLMVLGSGFEVSESGFEVLVPGFMVLASGF